MLTDAAAAAENRPVHPAVPADARDVTDAVLGAEADVIWAAMVVKAVRIHAAQDVCLVLMPVKVTVPQLVLQSVQASAPPLAPVQK